jgi:hypothetical protein
MEILHSYYCDYLYLVKNNDVSTICSKCDKKSNNCVYYDEKVRPLADNTLPFSGHFLVWSYPLLGFFMELL